MAVAEGVATRCSPFEASGRTLSNSENPARPMLQKPNLGIIIPNMGTNNIPLSGVAGALFSSVQQRVLALLFTDPEQEFSTSDVIRIAGSGTGAVHRELGRLASSGLVTIRQVGNQKRYSANRGSPIFQELQSLILKTVGLAGPLREALVTYADRIRTAFVYGSVATGGDTSKSDIDLMVLGDGLVYAELFEALESTEKKLGRKISPNVMTLAEWKQKLRHKNAFVSRVAGQPKLFVLGSGDDLGGPEQAGQDRPAQDRSRKPAGI